MRFTCNINSELSY